MARIKKRWIGLVLLFITTVGMLIGWNWQVIQRQPRAVETSFRERLAPNPPSKAPVPVVAPTIDAQRVMADLEALSFRRYADDERLRARQYIADALQQAGWVPQEQGYDTGVNVYAERPGTDPEAGTILLAAHYDTVERSPGLDDNASGIAAILETARLLGTVSTPRTLQVAFFDEEELGLLGSLAFANGKADRDVLKGAIVLDMVGYACHTDGCQSYPSVLPVTPTTTRGDFLAVLGDRGHLPLLNSFPESRTSDLPSVLTMPIPLLGPLTPDLMRSDHAPFWQKGIGAVLVTDTANFRNPNYHRETDLLESIDQPFFIGATQIIVNATATLLSTPESLATAASHPAPTADSPALTPL
ncbi:M28 family peptidase [Oculatella sp. LEGE 06141]|uniref:M28 family peptidase n=1 Tax=Oculatella sp. LEGE 06141 TaxID=1828648 RepID=UPI001880442E|nr:M28 family peptidase [Oculatella sp. LEGE 06141]MBE9176983.1 M28 family peptidase [Oculatella sp. LEGE 06141]